MSPSPRSDRSLTPSEEARRPENLQWEAGPGSNASLDQEDDLLSGWVEPTGTAACYVTLGPAPLKYAQLRDSEGMIVRHDELHVAAIAMDAEGGVTATILVMEYNAAGARLRILRFRDVDAVRHRPSADADRIVVAIRIEGQGRLNISRISWRSERGVFDAMNMPWGKEEEAAPLLVKANKTVVLNGDGTSEPFTLWPNGNARFLAADIAPGRYELIVAHRDPELGARKRALSVELAFSDLSEPGYRIQHLGLTKQADGTFVPGPPTIRKGTEQFMTTFEFSTLSAQHWIAGRVELDLDRLVNVDRVTVRPKPVALPTPAEDLFAEKVASFLEQVRGAEDIEHLVYCDVSLNIVDGSSIWVSSLLSMLTSAGRCAVISKYNIENDVVLSNVPNRDRVTVVQPSSLRHRSAFTVEEGVVLLRRLDEQLPSVRNIVVRGCAVAEQLFATRQFDGRAFAYLTDFYEIGEDGIVVPDASAATVQLSATHAHAMLTQNAQVAEALAEVADRPFTAHLLPPAVPPLDLEIAVRHRESDDRVSIGYAGKINPLWGVLELLEWAEDLRARGIGVDILLVSNKISDRLHGERVPGMRKTLDRQIEKLDAVLEQGFNREQSMTALAAMDFVWCWRPAELEDVTLELSTKLVEMVANGARCICYPNTINREVLGEDYPFFAEGLDDIVRIIETNARLPDGLAERVREAFDIDRIGQRLLSECFHRPETEVRPKILFAGNGLKFIEPYASYLKREGHSVKTDRWDWGRAYNASLTVANAEWADLIFCEWGLANAVYHSRNLKEGQRLFVRCHAQEIREKARRFGHAIVCENVEKFIFVSEHVRRVAIDMFGWPEEKTVVIPNFLLDNEYQAIDRRQQDALRLGLVGMVPTSKRFDRAIDLLEELVRRGHDAQLHIKGHRPEDLDFMYGAGRISELAFYFEQYDRLDSDPSLKGRVLFDGWANDVAHWYGSVDAILSPSDHESFHYALADGALTGCLPVVWPWADAERLYPADWVVTDTASAADRIETFLAIGPDEKEAQRRANRQYLINAYGHEKIFGELDTLLGLGQKDR